MIKISEDHKNIIIEELADYNIGKYKKTLKNLEPILEHYHKFGPSKIGKRLLNSLFKSWKNKPNEAIIHYWTICQLVDEFNYPIEHIDHEVACGNMGRKAMSGSTHADIVVYTHSSRRAGTALTTIECRKLGGINGATQAASYSRALNSVYHLFTDSEIWDAYETRPHPVDGTPISNIPIWFGDKPTPKRLSKAHKLPPITDEKQLRDLVNLCHNKIHSEGFDPAKAFDELVKLLFVKVFDEQEIPDKYQFSVLKGESAKETGEHIRKLLKKAKSESKYKELFSQPGDDEFSISNKAIRKVVETFQGFSFSGDSLIGIDAKGTVYENMVGSTFRGELGQYFTPRKIVEFMVDLLNPSRNDLILDPACGSGGFLIYNLRKVANRIRKEQKNLPIHKVERQIDSFIKNNIYGADINPRMIRAARMNMIMHGDGWSGVQRSNGLLMQEHEKFEDLYGEFSLIFSNPPFAGFEMDDSILEQYKVGKNENGLTRGVNKAIIFVEQIINLLKEGGRAGLVLPRSIFENESYSFKKIRKLLYEKTEIIASIGLPKTAFHHTDCGILGDLLFIEKKSEPRANYPVFVSWANDVGYNTLGHNIEENDLPQILDSFKVKDEGYMISFEKLLENDNLNPWNYHPEAKKFREKVAANKSSSVKLTKLVSVYDNRISRSNLKETPDKTLKYSQVGDFDPINGSYTYRELKINRLPSRATYELNGEELILIPNARNSLESDRKIIKVGEDSKGLILTNRFIPLRPQANSDFLIYILNTDYVRNQFISLCKGAGSPDLRPNKLDKVLIPVPNSEDLSSVDVFMEEIADQIALKEKLQNDLEETKYNISENFGSLIKDTKGEKKNNI